MKITCSFLFTLAFSCSPALCQVVSFGVTGGLPMLDRTLPSGESRPYVVGPSVEFHLRGGFAIEADALYQRVGNTSFGSIIGIPAGAGSSTTQLLNFTDRSRGNEWQFPVLGKYYFHTKAAWQPFVGLGLAERYLTSSETSSQATNINGLLQTNLFTFHGDRLSTGIVAAAGIRLRTGRLQWLPQFRYSRWGRPGNLTQANEADFVLGFRF